MSSSEECHTTDELIDRARAAETRVHHWSMFQRIMLVLVAIALVGGVAFASVAYSRQNDIRDGQRKQACIAAITAEFQGAVGDALLAPPAPNVARTDAVDRIQAAARKLHHLDRYCP